jgi:hypothetical protein
MSAYLIPTKTGPKGPFTEEQIRRLAGEGKLPPGFRVLEAETRRPVVVEEILGPQLLDADLVGEGGPEAAAPTEPPPAAGPARCGPVRKRLGLRGKTLRLGGIRKPAPAGIGGRGAPAAGRPSALRGGAARHAAAKSKPPVALYIILGLVGLLMIPALWWTLTGKIEGTWVIDEKEFAAQAEREAIRTGGEDAAKRLFYKAIALKMVQGLTVEIDKTSATFTYASAREGAPGRSKKYVRQNDSGSRCDLLATRPDGKAETWGVDLRADRLYLTAGDGRITYVLRRP